jgi:hypothetical protein
MSSYCTESEIYDYGFPRGGVPNQGRLVASVDTSANTFTLGTHGFADDDVVQFRADGSGTLPTGVSAATAYYVIRVDESRFQVAATAGGAAINISTAGSRIVVFTDLPIAAAITWASSMIEDMLPAHVVPLEEPYPDIIRSTCAELAAGKLAARTGAASKSLSDIVEQAHKRLARWGKHVPIRGTNAPQSASLAASSTARQTADPSGFRRYGGIS